MWVEAVTRFGSSISFLLKLPFSEPIPVDVCSLIAELCKLVLAPFQSSTTSSTPVFSPPPPNNKLAHFPNLPRIRGIPAYSADQRTTHCAPEDQDACRKYSSSHPTLLTPGIFTIYCPHGVCCGFEVMRSHESPKRPFKIVFTRFETPPDIIIYDNCCKRIFSIGSHFILRAPPSS